MLKISQKMQHTMITLSICGIEYTNEFTIIYLKIINNELKNKKCNKLDTLIPLSLDIALNGLSDLKVRKTFKKPIFVFELLNKNPQFNKET
jgi:hypothetical protein